MLFSRPEYEEIMLPFRYVKDPSDPDEAGLIDLEAYGSVFGETKYIYASYSLKHPNMYENGDYEQMIELLKNTVGKMVKVVVKLKKGEAKDAKIDIDSIAEAFSDERFGALELLSWGFNDRSFEEMLRKEQ